MIEFTQQLKAKALELGFALHGVVAAAEPGRLDQLHRWLDAGYAGQMHYIPERREAYRHPRNILDGCRSLLMLGMPYRTEEPAEMEPGKGRVARYAWSDLDYHDVIHDRLKSLKTWLESHYPHAQVRGIVDTAPLLEREFAEAAGLGWVGKNTLLLNRQWGSYFFLAALLTDLELRLDAPYEKGYCGTCTACLAACPTDAFPRPYILDASRCISYLTIEHQESVAEDVCESMGDWVFGCDICQQVCPWNHKAALALESTFEPRSDTHPLDVISSLEMSEQDFHSHFRKTPLWRAKRRGFLRNCILVAGNQRLHAALPALERLRQEPDSMISDAAEWAIDRIRSAAAQP